MTKERVSSDVERKLRIELDEKANAIGISRAKLIEISLKSELGHFNIHKENKRLTEARTKAEEETEELRQQLTTAEQEHKNRCNQFEREKTQLTEQRDEFEKLLHAETDAYNKCYERAESLKKERNTLKEKVQIAEKQLATDEQRYQSASDGLRKQRDTFKTRFEDTESNYRACSEKLTLLLTRNWWERLWNKLPWITEISLPTDETIE